MDVSAIRYVCYQAVTLSAVLCLQKVGQINSSDGTTVQFKF